MKKIAERGFTLIELLVVIAIIGILASVILASLNSARAKGIDAATQSDLSNALPQAEIFYDTNNSYDNVCSTASTSGGINTMIVDAGLKSGAAYSPGDTQSAYPRATVCHDAPNAWVAEVPLKSVTTGPQGSGTYYFCVDSTGNAKKTMTQLPSAGTYQFSCQ